MSKDICKDKVSCLYCGKKTDIKRFIINPKAREELLCCSGECLSNVRKFIDYDSKNRMKLYILLFILIVINLFFIGFDINSRWRYLPLLLIALSVYSYPLVFTRYIMYQRFGIIKTLRIVKVFCVFIAAFSVLLIISY
ncbi:hypothetical protein [Clostridium polynesiense]|uniref:hypothetical protein n=1 Tax=Clostridium polynesiense TaxID=1325933 RepID=UPI00058FEF2F|nr:hypothetical protein [Clostridium polynesiense]